MNVNESTSMTMPDVPDQQVPVLIVGGGYAGLASSLFLAQHGVHSLLVDRHAGVSVQGRARGINQRTMEIYRPLGLEAAIQAVGAPFTGDAGVARCQSLTGPWEWLFEPEPPATWAEASPCGFCMADQGSVEPILIGAARARGAELRFNTELVAFEPDECGVTALIQDRTSGECRTVRASYLIAADGHRSPIREQLGIARPGPGITQHWLSIVFDADLTGIIERRALFWIVLNPALGFAAFTTTATPGRWAIGISYDPATQSPADFAPERCVEVVRAVVGRDDLPVEVVDVGAWEEAVGVADRYRAGRVFLVGDSAHVWPPAGAMGANSAVQDAHNLAWKLAAVLHGWAGDSLLDSYEAERRPVALELAQLTVQRQAARFGGGQEIDDLDDLNCMLGQRYQSRAIVAPTHDTVFGRQLADEAEPGSRAPHLWIERDGRCISPHDLFSDAFVLLSAEPSWVDAARRLAARMSLPLRAYRVGSASEHADQGERADLVDCSGAWASRYRVGSRGAALIRPDGYVAWLTAGADTNPEAALASALCQVVCRAADYDADADFVAP